MLTKAIEVQRYVRASAGRAGLGVVFEDVDQPRHDGKNIYLPRITLKTTEDQLKQLMASVDHEVAHDRFSCFDLIKETKLPAEGVIAFVWNFLEDSRVNAIEAREYLGFRENYDECSSVLIEGIIKNASKASGSLTALLAINLIYWETKISQRYFPLCESAASKATPNKDVQEVLDAFTKRLVDCQHILPRKGGSKATYDLAIDILKAFMGDKEVEQLIEALVGKVAHSDSGDDDPGDSVDGEGSPSDSGSSPTDAKGDEGKSAVSKEYKIYKVKITEDDLEKFSLSKPEHEKGLNNIGLSFDPITTTRHSHWDLTDYDKFDVRDFPKKKGPDKFFAGDSQMIEFISEYRTRTAPKLIAQENFAQQVRRLIQIRAKVQREYGIKKGKLDQARLARICFDAPGFNERVFKRKIENKTLDAALTVLVDMSGSMNGDKVQYALASTLLLNEVCQTINIPLEILGFTDGCSSSGHGVVPLMFIYKGFSDLHVNNDFLIEAFGTSISSMCGNPDGENIIWAHDRLVKRKEKKKMLVVLSDGSPAASKSSSGLQEFTLEAIREIEDSKVVDIYGLGICSDSVTHFYRASSVVYNPEDIPIKLLELIEKKILM